jgi:PAS domain S-box-containing protein
MFESEQRHRITAEDELQFCAALLNNTTDAIHALDMTGTIIYVNDTMCRATGYAREDLVGKNISMLNPPGQADQVPANLKTIDENGEARFEMIHVRKDGSTFPVEAFAKRIETQGRKYIIAVDRDISERKRFEENLQLTQFAVDHSADAIFWIDTNGTFVYVNEMSCRMLGYSRDELLTMKLFDVDPAFSEEGWASHWQEMRERQSAATVESRPRRKDGSEILAEITVNHVQFGSRELHCLSVRDITERRDMQNVMQNTEKLESLGILAGGIAHDFNNLLGGLFGYMDMAREYAQAGNTKSAVANLTKGMNAFERARSLTQQLLTFSKGSMPFRKIMAIDGFVRETVQFALSGSNVSPVFDIPPDVWACDIDEQQISQVIDNITINARQAMPLGGNLDVSLANVAAADAPASLARKPFVCVSIRDYGTGIAQELIPRIFDPFFTTKQQGSGLGLATCYSIVSKHEGCIDVSSELGKGTVFHVFLPAASGQAAIAGPVSGRRHKGHGRVLVMDDEEFISDLAAEMLQSIGYTVERTRNGDEAVAAVKKLAKTRKSFAAAIFDLTIPGGRGGKEIAKIIADLDPSIRMIASSGYSDDPVMANPSEYGFKAKLVKPYQKEDMQRVMAEVMDNA